MFYSPTVYVTDGAHKSQVQQFGEIVLHGNIYPQLSLEKRTMIHPQLERGIKLAAIAVGLNRFAIDAVSRTSSKRLGSPVRASWPSTFSGGRRLQCRYGPDGVQACRASRTACGPPPCGTRAPAT